MNIATQFDGTFDLEFLRRGESVRSAGKDSHAVLVKTQDDEIRVELNEWLIRTPGGRLLKQSQLPEYVR